MIYALRGVTRGTSLRWCTISLIVACLPAALPAVGTSPAAAPSRPVLFFENSGYAQKGRAPLEAIASDLRASFGSGGVEILTTDGLQTMEFDGAASTMPFGVAPGAARANFLMGNNRANWSSGRIFDQIRYRDIYPGIDLIYRGEGGKLKADWVIEAGHGAAGIRWRYPGAKRVWVEQDGALQVDTGTGILRESAPFAYQEVAGIRREVRARFRVEPAEAGKPRKVGFELGEYDATLPVVIDPTLAYSTYLGGSRNDAAYSMALDGNGSMYIAGYTESSNAPIQGAIQAFRGSVDVYVLKLSANGTQLQYATFLGGSGDDRAYGIAVDSTGAAYVTGSTSSANFPVAGAVQSTNAGGRDAFVVKLNSSGTGLVYGTYLGGAANDTAYGIALDPYNQAYVAGDTQSTNFPVKFGFQMTYRGGLDAFTFKLNANGGLTYSTYFGGSGDDSARSIAVSANQLTAYVTGYTWSTNLPVWAPRQPASGGGQDAFVVRFNSDANGLVYSTYLGGSGGTVSAPEMGLGISVDIFNNAYVTGTTSSANFPLLVPVQPSLGGVQDAFVAKYESGGVASYSTYLGGNGSDWGTAVYVDANRRAYVVGYTSSNNFPLASPSQATFGGVYDAFLTEYDANGATVLFSTYLGGNSSDAAYGVVVNVNGEMYLTGLTSSPNFPTAAAYLYNSAGATDIFVSKVTPAAVPATPPAFLSLSPNQGAGSSQTFTLVVTDANGANDINSVQMLINSTFTGVNSCHIAYVPATNLLYLLNNAATAWLGGLPPGNVGVIANSQCSLNLPTATAVRLGSTYTLGLPMTFAPTYAGSKFLYLMAVDNGGLRADWAAYGTWTVQ
jgi:hypothetical protein